MTATVATWSNEQGAYFAPSDICDAFIAAHEANNPDNTGKLGTVCTYGKWQVIDFSGNTGLATDDTGAVWISAGKFWFTPAAPVKAPAMTRIPRFIVRDETGAIRNMFQPASFEHGARHAFRFVYGIAREDARNYPGATVAIDSVSE